MNIARCRLTAVIQVVSEASTTFGAKGFHARPIFSSESSVMILPSAAGGGWTLQPCVSSTTPE